MLFLILFQDWSGFSCSFHFSRFSCRLLRSSLASCVNLALIRSFVGVTLLDRLLECFSSPCVHELNMGCFPSNSCYFLFRVVLFFRHRIGKLLWAIFLLSFPHNFISNPFIFQNSHLSQLIHLLYILTAAFVLQMLCLLSARPSSASVVNGCWRSPHSLSWPLLSCPGEMSNWSVSNSDPPTVEPVFMEMRQGLGRPVVMTCRVLRAHPSRVLRFEWLLSNRLLHAGAFDAQRDETEYTVRNLNRDGLGEYTCNVINEAGAGKCTFLVTGEALWLI